MSLGRTMARKRRLAAEKAANKARRNSPLPRWPHGDEYFDKMIAEVSAGYPEVVARPYNNPLATRPGNEGGNNHTGPNKPDKGLRDGSCNRTACQRPLKNEPMRMSMPDHSTTNGRLYYCCACARDFYHWDLIDRPGEPPRCSIYPGDEK